jgi:hypothetical protein
MVDKLPKIVEFAQMKIERQTANSKTRSEFKVFKQELVEFATFQKEK